MHHWPDVPSVLRVLDRAPGFALGRRFGFLNARLTVDVAAPWFIGAASGLQVLDSSRWDNAHSWSARCG